MKKAALAILCLSVMNTANAQLYIRAGAGFAFPQAGQTMDGATSLYNGMIMPYSGSRNNGTSFITYNIKDASFSSGMLGILGLGYMFTNNIGVQLDASFYQSSTKYTFSDNLTTVYYSSGPLSSNVKVVQQANKPILLMPAMVLQTSGNKVNVYSRFGIALPVRSTVTQDLIISNAPGTGALTTDDYTFRVKNSFSLGFTAAAGVQYKINDRFSVWGELSVLSMSLSVKEAEITNYSSNGFNYPPAMGGLPVAVKYSKTATLDSTGTTAVSYAQPFSNMGINIGISYKLSAGSRNSGGNNGMLDNGSKRKRF